MPPDSSGQEIFAKAAAGDRQAFEALVHSNQSLVFSLAWHFLGNAASAEELAQDVFLELHRALPGLGSAEHATNWLRRVTTHRCIDYVRRERRHPRLGLDEVLTEPVREEEDTDLLLQERLRRLTASLPERARAVLLLRYQEDMPPGEISKLLDMPLNTVKSHLQRSLALLREKLERAKVSL